MTVNNTETGQWFACALAGKGRCPMVWIAAILVVLGLAVAFLL